VGVEQVKAGHLLTIAVLEMLQNETFDGLQVVVKIRAVRVWAGEFLLQVVGHLRQFRGKIHQFNFVGSGRPLGFSGNRLAVGG
jgi:hypothetical protein